MYDYLKRELERRSLLYAEVKRSVEGTPEVIFVIATDKDFVYEIPFVFKNGSWAMIRAEIGSGSFNNVLKDYLDGCLSGGAGQEIEVWHNENIVQLCVN